MLKVPAWLAPEEGQQVDVELIRVRVRQAVRCARIVDLLGVLNKPCRFLRCVVNGHDLVVLAMQNQGRDVDLLEILGEVGLGEGLDALVGVLLQPRVRLSMAGPSS